MKLKLLLFILGIFAAIAQANPVFESGKKASAYLKFVRKSKSNDGYKSSGKWKTGRSDEIIREDDERRDEEFDKERERTFDRELDIPKSLGESSFGTSLEEQQKEAGFLEGPSSRGS